MSDYAWQPAEDGAVKTVYGGDIDVAGGTELYVYVAGRRHTKQLRADYRLCRRVPAPAQGVPLKAIRYLVEQAILTHAGRVELVRQVIDWLDAQEQEASE